MNELYDSMSIGMKFTESTISQQNPMDLEGTASVEQLLIDKETGLFQEEETKQQEDPTVWPTLAAT